MIHVGSLDGDFLFHFMNNTATRTFYMTRIAVNRIIVKLDYCNLAASGFSYHAFALKNNLNNGWICTPLGGDRLKICDTNAIKRSGQELTTQNSTPGHKLRTTTWSITRETVRARPRTFSTKILIPPRHPEDLP